MNFTIREARSSDASEIARVHVASWKTTYKGIVPQQYLDSLDEKERKARWEEVLGGQSKTFVAEDAGGLCGFIGGGSLREPIGAHDCEVYAVYLLAQAQRQRIGTALMGALAKALAQAGYHKPLVWVLVDNPSRTFYARLGGAPVAEKPIEIGGMQFIEVAYGWESMDALLRIGRENG